MPQLGPNDRAREVWYVDLGGATWPFSGHGFPIMAMTWRPLLAALLCVGCKASDRPDTATLTPLPSPAAVRSGEPFLTTDAAGAVHMTWIERTGDSTHAVRYARLDTTDTWTAPSTVVDRKDLFVNWADYPSVIATTSGR